MKTTNFENSKKLAEIGFKKESAYVWTDNSWGKGIYSLVNKYMSRNVGECFLSYDLETILDALPKTLVLDEGLPTIYQGKLKIFFDVEGKNYIGYQNFEGFHPKFTIEQEAGESLADTASKLLTKLCEAGIINFNK